MKRYALSGIIFLTCCVLSSTAQVDSLRKGSMHFKSIRIIGNDTVVNEKHIDLNDSNPGTNFYFRFGDDFDTLIQDFGVGPDLDIDSLIHQYFAKPFDRFSPFFPGDSMFSPYRFRFPNYQYPDGEPYWFDYRQIRPEQFQIPEYQDRGRLWPSRIPSFSIEDVAIYPEENSVRNFVIKPVAGSNMLMVEADLDNKRTVYSVYDNRGKVLQYEKLKKVDREFRRVLKLDDLKSGIYFVEIKNGKSTKKKRLTIR